MTPQKDKLLKRQFSQFDKTTEDKSPNDPNQYNPDSIPSENDLLSRSRND